MCKHINSQCGHFIGTNNFRQSERNRRRGTPHHYEYNANSSQDPFSPDDRGEGWLLDSRDGVSLLVGCLSRKVGTRFFLLFLEIEAVPVVGERSALPLPVFQERNRWKKFRYFRYYSPSCSPPRAVERFETHTKANLRKLPQNEMKTAKKTVPGWSNR